LIQFLYIHGPWIAAMAAITIQSSFSTIPVPNLGFSLQDKLLHFIAYGVLGWLLMRGMYLSKKPALRQYMIPISLGVGLLFGMSDELHQYFVPGRDADVWDWVADALGIVLFGLAYYYQHRKNGHRLSKEAQG